MHASKPLFSDTYKAVVQNSATKRDANVNTVTHVQRTAEKGNSKTIALLYR